MEILAFSIRGKFAHFRKYYANNTAMSFSIPPRTSIIGMLAAIVGIEKEQYHECFKSEKLDVALAVKSSLKKNFYRLNLLSIKGPNDFSGRGGHIQTPFEIVSGLNPRKDEVTYRIYLRNKKMDHQDWIMIVNAVLNKKTVYNLTMGTANFHAHIGDSVLYSDDRLERLIPGSEFIPIGTTINISEIEDIRFADEQQYNNEMIEEELLPADFVKNGNRELSAMNRLLFSTGDYPAWVRLYSETEVIHIKDEETNICFQKIIE